MCQRLQEPMVSQQRLGGLAVASAAEGGAQERGVGIGGELALVLLGGETQRDEAVAQGCEGKVAAGAGGCVGGTAEGQGQAGVRATLVRCCGRMSRGIESLVGSRRRGAGRAQCGAGEGQVVQEGGLGAQKQVVDAVVEEEGAEGLVHHQWQHEQEGRGVVQVETWVHQNRSQVG